MPNVNRWALKYETSAPNPGAGIGVGRAENPRSEADMQPQGSASMRDWQPTVLNLGVLILLELVAFAALRYVFRSAHGG